MIGRGWWGGRHRENGNRAPFERPSLALLTLAGRHEPSRGERGGYSPVHRGTRVVGDRTRNPVWSWRHPTLSAGDVRASDG
jgi:hypothetical protein